MLFRICVICVICGLFFSCAAQAPPQPPRVERPQAIKDLAVHQVGRTLEISFTLPTLATDGERLTKPIEAAVFRTLQGVTAVPLSRAAPWTTFSAADLARQTRRGKLIQAIPLTLLEYRAGQSEVLRFTVCTLTRGFRRRAIESGDSNMVSLQLLDVSEPVTNLKIETTEHAVKLSWSAPTRTLSGRAISDLSGYQVYRSGNGKPGTYQLLGETQPPAFSNPNFQFGQTYFYKVRAVFSEDGQTAESDDSIPAVITPRDVFPPAAPAGLTGLYTAGVVELIWNASSESDLAGYNVYRRGAAGEFRRLNTELVPTPIFRDSTTAPGGRYTYRATAVDLSGNESAPSQAVDVDAR
ncbi:MAG TPA: hypothetical protein VGW33_08300 [Terriglobia bacterium]|nr:hypothetical protein [Terriglobia bacterium]